MENPMSILNDVIARGNRGFDPRRRTPNTVRCADGYTLSVIAGEGCYCQPRPDRDGVLGDAPGDYPGPYTHVEVGFPSARPEPWDQWQAHAEDGKWNSVYSYVPVELVRELVAAHGGEVAS
jgi:hypothetical protein